MKTIRLNTSSGLSAIEKELAVSTLIYSSCVIHPPLVYFILEHLLTTLLAKLSFNFPSVVRTSEVFVCLFTILATQLATINKLCYLLLLLPTSTLLRRQMSESQTKSKMGRIANSFTATANTTARYVRIRGEC